MTYLYYVALLVPMLLFIIPNKLSSRTQALIASTPIILIIVLRFGAGTDYFSYEYIYNSVDISSIKNFITNSLNVEVGYRLLMVVPRILNLPFHFFVVGIGLLMFVLYFKWIEDSSKNPVMSLLLFYSMFFLVWNLSALRQGFVLAIGTYAFYNKKFELKLHLKVIIIALLATVHISALLYAFFLICDKLNFNRKTLILIFLGSIIVSLLPIYKILPMFSFIPGISKVTNYIEGPIAVFNFAGIARLMMFAFVAFSYRFIENDLYDVRLAQNFLVGNSLFFLLKFSDLVAARMSAYTFILAIVLFVNIFQSLNQKKIITFGLSIVVSLTSFIYFQKEVSAYHLQVGIINPTQFITFDSILDYDRNVYYNRYNNLTYQRNACSDRKLEFKESLEKETQLVDYQAGDILIVVRSKDLFGVINQNRQWIIEPSFKGEPEIHGTVLKHNDSYYDLTLESRPVSELETEYENERALDEAFLNTEMNNNGMLFKNLHVSSRRLILEPHLIKQAVIEYSTEPTLYYRAKFSYLGYDTYIYMNQDQRPIVDHLFPSEGRFNRQGIMKIRGYCGIEIVSIDGTVLWME